MKKEKQMNDLNPVWLLESPFYQYNNFKKIIEYSKWDAFCLYNKNECTRKNKALYNLKGESVDPNTLTDKYSVIIQTGSNLFPNQIDVLQLSKSRKVIRMTHSISGLSIDQIAAMPLTNYKQLFGLYPKVWLNIKEISDRFKKIEKNGKLNHIEGLDTHPYLVKVIEPIQAEIEKDSVGILLSNCTNVKHYVQTVLNGLKIRNKKYDNIYIRRHPLKNSNVIKAFEPLRQYTNNVVEANPYDEDKNHFFDRCETILAGGLSSTFIETNLRNNYHNRPQKIFAINEIVRVGMEDLYFKDSLIDCNDWEVNTEYKPWTLYNDFLNITTEKGIYDSFLNSINNVLSRIEL
jgi:hypothetical protein